jgi:hypothetical protein
MYVYKSSTCLYINKLSILFPLSHEGVCIFVEQSSTIECYSQPPPKIWKQLSAPRVSATEANLSASASLATSRPHIFSCFPHHACATAQLQFYSCTITSFTQPQGKCLLLFFVKHTKMGKFICDKLSQNIPTGH